MLIETERLTLRGFVAEDRSGVLCYQTDPRYPRYYEWTGRTEDAVRAFVGMFVGWQGEQPRTGFPLAIEMRAEGRLIGTCGLRPARIARGRHRLRTRACGMGHGYAIEATRAIVAFGFDTLGLHRIGAACVADNVASAHVLEKIGLRREGWLREVARYRGRWWDELVYGILADDWRMRR